MEIAHFVALTLLPNFIDCPLILMFRQTMNHSASPYFLRLPLYSPDNLPTCASLFNSFSLHLESLVAYHWQSPSAVKLAYLFISFAFYLSTSLLFVFFKADFEKAYLTAF